MVLAISNQIREVLKGHVSDLRLWTIVDLDTPWQDADMTFEGSVVSLKRWAHTDASPMFSKPSTIIDRARSRRTFRDCLPIEKWEELKHDDVIKWKHFPRNWSFVRGIHRSPVNSPHKGQWRGALMFSLICVWVNDWINIREAGDLRRNRAHYDVIVMKTYNMLSDVIKHHACPLPAWSRICRQWDSERIYIRERHRGRDKLADFSQTTFSNAFSSMKMLKKTDSNFTEICSSVFI